MGETRFREHDKWTIRRVQNVEVQVEQKRAVDKGESPEL